MNTPFRRDAILTAIAFATPMLAVAGARHLGWPAQPASAEAAPMTDEADAAEDHFHQMIIPPRTAIAPVTEAGALLDKAAAQAAAWTAPIFPPPPALPAETAPQGEPSARPDTVATPTPTPGAAAYAELYNVSSLMAARDGNIAVIDRKLRRVGDAVGPGVVVESIDLEARIVVLLTADGVAITRRTVR
jgi:hypothetical protein